MAKKLQSYFIYKIQSNRLKREKYNITLPLSEAFENGEVVRLSDCQLLRSIRRITGKKEYNPTLEKALKNLRNNKASKESVKKVREQIESKLFVDSIVYIEFNDARHYEKLIANGLFINGEEFVRLLSSAGNARKKTTMFCKKSIWEDLNYILDCGRDPEHKINPSKFNAYYALCGSGGFEIDIPRIVVIPDKIVKRMTKVDFVSENHEPLQDPLVEEKEIEIEFNLFDGQGLMSRTFANMIADVLELDYTESAVVFRGAWQKGMLTTFDLQDFSETYNVSKITDIYGKVYDIKDIDVVLSESQFKLNKAYTSTEQYLEECKKRNYKWTITRPTPKNDRNSFSSNYQYTQATKMTDESIEKLCRPTINYLKNVSGLSWIESVLFLMGDIEEKNLSKEWFDGLDNTLKQLLYKPEIITDKYIQNKLSRMLGKKINEACEGKLLLDGNYQVMISDSYAMAQWAFGMEVTGLLKEREFYSQYWNNKNVNKVVAMRSPLTFQSELNVLDLKRTEEMDRWYHYNNSGIMYNCFDISTLLHAGSDWDFDIAASTNNQEMINGSVGGLPVVYEKKTAPKQRIDFNELWKADVRTYQNKIGFLTNLSSTMYSMISKYKQSDWEYNVLLNRLKISVALQSQCIDHGKGIEVMEIPKFWTNWNKWKDDDSQEEIEQKKKHNKLLVEQRPYFMTFTYYQKAKKYKEHIKIYDDYCRCHYRMGIKDLILVGAEGNSDKQKCLDFFFRYSPVSDDPSIMNKVSHLIENEIKIKQYKNDFGWEFDVDKLKLTEMENLYKLWNSNKSISADEHDFENRKYRRMADEISINSKEIARLALMTNRRFANNIFGEDILELFKRNVIEIPVLDKNGDKLFYGNRYKIISFNVEE